MNSISAYLALYSRASAQTPAQTPSASPSSRRKSSSTSPVLTVHQQKWNNFKEFVLKVLKKYRDDQVKSIDDYYDLLEYYTEAADHVRTDLGLEQKYSLQWLTNLTTPNSSRTFSKQAKGRIEKYSKLGSEDFKIKFKEVKTIIEKETNQTFYSNELSGYAIGSKSSICLYVLYFYYFMIGENVL